MTFAPLVVPELGKAALCVVSASHKRPATLVFVWHHVQPQVCGGLTVEANLVSICDSCHRTIHVLLFLLAKSQPIPAGWGMRIQREIAQRGFDACLAAGTVAKIPNEGMPAVAA